MEMNDRLSPLVFLPPPMATPWTGTPPHCLEREVPRAGRTPLKVSLPLFWYHPPWHRLPPKVADAVATEVAKLNVLVSALHRDLADGPNDPKFPTATFDDDENESEHGKEKLLPRIVPYRPERYGLLPDDFDGATIIDVRLAITRDAYGRFAFSPEQIQRWEARAEDAPLAGGGWVPAATFPPDVASLDHLHSKLDQLRALSPTAAVFVSINAYRLATELPDVLSQRPDGIILRCEDESFNGLRLAEATCRAATMIKDSGVAIPLWIVPGWVTADDVAKLVTLGASAVAIDSWGDELIDGAEVATSQSPAARLGYSSHASTDTRFVAELVDETLAHRIERVEGLLSSIVGIMETARMVSTDPEWSKILGMSDLQFGA